MNLQLIACTAALGLMGQEPPRTPPEASVVLVRGYETGSSVMPVGSPCGSYRQGSGVVVAPGVVATNAHVVGGASRVEIQKGERIWIVRNFCMEADRDLCLLRIPDLSVPEAPPAQPQDIQPGHPVIAVGYPGGSGPKHSQGQLAATWSYRGSYLIESDTPTAPGSSGGGLFSEDGKLLGITTFVFEGSPRFNFSIPIDWIQGLLSGNAHSARLSCPGVPRANITQDFIEHMAEDPANWSAWQGLADAWVQGAPGNAEAWFAKGIAMELRLQQQPNLASDPENVRFLESALEAYRRVVSLKPDHAKAWNNLGTALDNLNRFEEALAAFQRALQIRPDYARAALNLGATLSNLHRYQAAVPAFERGLAQQPDEALSWSRLAFCEGALGRWPEAAKHYRIALGLNPVRVGWCGDLYQACLRAGDPEGAALALGHLRNLDPRLAQQLSASK